MLMEEWAVIRREANEVVNSPVVEEFRLLCEMYFEDALEGKGPFRRRPSVSLRLVGDLPVATKLVACPCGSVRHGEFVPHPDEAYCELLQEHPRIVNGEEVRKFTRRLTVTVKPEGTSIGAMYTSAVEDAGSALGVMADFISDARTVFARSHDHCCVLD